MANSKMFFSKSLIKWLLVTLLVFLGASFYKWAPWIKQDNPIEEKIEYIIEVYTGQDVDLSPDTPENNKIEFDADNNLSIFNPNYDYITTSPSSNKEQNGETK